LSKSDDLLCLVADGPISDKRCRFLDQLGVAVIWQDGEAFAAGSRLAGDVFAG
jgi:hypothetical protein